MRVTLSETTMTIPIKRRAAILLGAACLLAGASAAVAQARRWDIPAPKAPPGAIGLKAPAAPLATLEAGARIATEDAQEAMRVVRARAGEWHVDPARIGFMGFSAGAITTMGLAYADDPATRPAFIAPIYGGLSAPARPVPNAPPPMWAAMAADDPLFGKTDFALIPAWEAKG